MLRKIRNNKKLKRERYWLLDAAVGIKRRGKQCLEREECDLLVQGRKYSLSKLQTELLLLIWEILFLHVWASFHKHRRLSRIFLGVLILTDSCRHCGACRSPSVVRHDLLSRWRCATNHKKYGYFTSIPPTFFRWFFTEYVVLVLLILN